MQDILSYNLDELIAIIKELGQPTFRAKQIYKWLYQYRDFNEMSDISLSLREKLSGLYDAQPIKILEYLEAKDGTRKYLYRLADGNIIEGAFMKQSYGNTLCVSTQVGCRMGCGFCASGIGGLVRNLTAGEILGQVLAVNRDVGGGEKRQITNIVLMGSGEPLDNYDNVVKFLRLVTDANGINISERNISLSTCGIVENIYKLADEKLNITLSISLHSTLDENRQKVMPVAKKYSINEILKAVKYYFEKTKRRIIFEYTMIKDVNMNYFDAKRLGEITKGYPSHVNLIMLNYVEEKGIKGCTKKEAERFRDRLAEFGVSATIRQSKGAEIGGACGQLRRKYLQNN